jgi:hypothetical protein
MISISKISKLFWIMSLNFILLKSNFLRLTNRCIIWWWIILGIGGSWKSFISRWSMNSFIGRCLIGGLSIIGGRSWFNWFRLILLISLVLNILILRLWIIYFINDVDINWFISLFIASFKILKILWFFWFAQIIWLAVLLIVQKGKWTVAVSKIFSI